MKQKDTFQKKKSEFYKSVISDLRDRWDHCINLLARYVDSRSPARILRKLTVLESL
jgi:hypothetical protein